MTIDARKRGAETDGALADGISVRHLGTVTMAEAGLWPSLEIVQHTGTSRLALVLMSDVGSRQMGQGTSHDEVLEIATQILSMRGQGVPALLHKLALGYVALHCEKVFFGAKEPAQ